MSLRLLVITDTLDAGSEKGSDVFCTALTHALRARHDVTVITSGAPDTGVLEVDGVIRLAPEVIADAAALEQALARHVAPEQFDFIYNLSGLGFGNTIGFTLLGGPRRIPLVNHFQTLLGSYALHEGYDHTTVDFNQEGQREIAKEAALNIFLSQSEYRDALLAGFDMSQSLASVIPAGVDRADVEGVVPSEVVPANGGKRPTVFLTAGRFSDYIKGGDLVYRAFTYLHRQVPDVFLVVVSNSPRFADLAARTARDRVQDRQLAAAGRVSGDDRGGGRRGAAFALRVVRSHGGGIDDAGETGHRQQRRRPARHRPSRPDRPSQRSARRIVRALSSTAAVRRQAGACRRDG